MSSHTETEISTISITPLLRRLWPSPGDENVTASEIALAISHIFTNQLSPVQTGALLTALHFTGWDRRADVIAQCAAVMRAAAWKVDSEVLRETIQNRGVGEGMYDGGLCDIVGTGGDSHNTFNVSTTASLICSALLLMSKHGNRASTSSSGSADLLSNASLSKSSPFPPNLNAVNPLTLSKLYEKTNYAFLFAPVFHPGMRYVTPIRRDLGWRTIFNLLGPLTNPVEEVLEARVIGIARRDLGPVFAEALKMSGSEKALVVCGEEDLDEVSCAGRTHCWMVKKCLGVGRCSHDDHKIQATAAVTPAMNGSTSTNSSGTGTSMTHKIYFTLHPSDFGLPVSPLSAVSPASNPDTRTTVNALTNATILRRILHDEMPADDPVLTFVLMNAAALFVVSGICEADFPRVKDGDDDGEVVEERGPGGGRWKEGVRRARWAIRSGRAREMWERFVEVSRSFDE